MVTFERTNDVDLIRRILTIEACWHRMVNDSTPLPEEFEVKQPERFTAVIAIEDEKTAGLFLIVPLRATEAEIHFCFMPNFWGHARRIAFNFVDWVWEETSLNRLVGPVPDYNPLALKLAKAVGFREVGSDSNVGTKHGKPFNLIVTELRRPHAI